MLGFKALATSQLQQRDAEIRFCSVSQSGFVPSLSGFVPAPTKKLAGGMVPTLFLTLFASPGQAGYAEDVLGLGPSLYYRLDETDIKPVGPESGSVVRNLATGGLLN